LIEPTCHCERSEAIPTKLLRIAITGYTAMTEKLDPEQVKEITGRIFPGVKQIASKY
jgi:hypothetical protein